MPKLEGLGRRIGIHSNKCRLIKTGTVAGISPTILVGFNLNLIVSSLLVRCALQRQRRSSNADRCDARVARKNA
ncbi:MAG: hypothetical protein QOH31_1343 [Verrucomicrobiota bacterium]